MANIGKKIADGLYGKMEFEFACNRGHAFGEYFMHGVINEILASSIDPHMVNLCPGFPEPALQTPAKGGRKRELDFALVDVATKQPITFVEAKWAGSSHCNEETILKDVSRLAVVHKAYPSSTSLFVLAGGKDAVEKVLGSGILGPQDKPETRLLTYPYHSYGRSFSIQRFATASQTEKLRNDLPCVPQKINTFLYKPSHAAPPNWRVLVWRIR